LYLYLFVNVQDQQQTAELFDDSYKVDSNTESIDTFLSEVEGQDNQATIHQFLDDVSDNDPTEVDDDTDSATDVDHVQPCSDTLEQIELDYRLELAEWNPSSSYKRSSAQS
jgi:hypothetical protein